MTTFKELGLNENILRAISELGFENPMPIQEKVIPFFAENDKDLVALAQTGTGKTAAFGLPILNRIDTQQQKIQALAIAPTRELCVQIANDLKNFSKYTDKLKVVAVYGGEDIVRQFKQLDIQPQILVATPGRLIDLIERGKVRLADVKYLVLDEADEMLNMGFKEDIERILQETPDTRRTLLFSATMPTDVARIAQRYMKEHEEIAVGRKNAGAENVNHIYYVVQAKQRYLALKRIVDLNPDIYGIVFCRTRQETKEVAEHLMKDGYNADALHGDLSQPQRDSVMQRFRIRNLQLLVATDVAARGLDVSDLTHVINYNLPDETESYTHRSGRTGRANKSGVSVSIIHTKEHSKIRNIERSINRKFEQQPIPNGLEVCKKQLFFLVDKMENVEVNEEQIAPYMPTIYQKLQYMDKEDIIKRFVSLEFNRFLAYYEDAVDLNIEARNEKRRTGKQDRIRLKLSMGARHGFSPKRLLGVINDLTQDKSINIGDIEITHKYSFFDVDGDQAEQVIAAFAGQDELQVSRVSSDNPRANSQRNRYKTTDNRRKTSDNRYQTSDNRQKTSDNRQKDNRHQTSDNRQKTSDNRQKTSTNKFRDERRKQRENKQKRR